MTVINERYKVAVELLNTGHPEKALPLLEVLASEGHIESMIRTAHCYVSGHGAARNLSLAAMHLEHASNAGSEVATQLLVLVTKTGNIEADHMYWQSYG
jgi:TPR repeat protein